MKRIAIVGAGIAGLALAGLLQRRDCEIHIFETATTLQPVGAGFTLQPNGLETLSLLGLGECIDRDACLVTNSAILQPSGEPLDVDVMKELSGTRRSVAIHRADIHRSLEAILGNRVTLHLGSRVASISTKQEGASLAFASGNAQRFDLVVGADGVNSAVRSSLFPSVELQLGQGIAVRTVIPLGVDPQDVPGFRAWMGEDKLVITYPVRAGKELNIVSYQPLEPRCAEAWTGSYPVEALQTLYRDWDPELRKLLEQVHSCFFWQLADMAPLSQFSRGATTLIGDAAHSMLPYLGQGANQALEDCRVLSEALQPWLDGQSSVDEALSAFDERRCEQVKEIVLRSRAAGEVFKTEMGNGVNKTKEIKKVVTPTTEPTQIAPHSVCLEGFHDAAAKQRMKSLLDRSQATGFDGRIGLVYEQVSPEGARANLMIGSQHHQPAGIAHGGVFSTLVEAVGSAAGSAWLLQHTPEARFVGTNNNTTFLRPVQSGKLTARARPVHRGRRTQVWALEIVDENGGLVAIGQLTGQNVTAMRVEGTDEH